MNILSYNFLIFLQENMTTNQGTGTFVRGHRRVASEWSGISTTSSNESEPLKRDENAEIRVVIFVEAQNEFNWFKNVFINGKFITVIKNRSQG